MSYIVPLIAASDKRVKDNIVVTKIKALDIINLIQHKSYDYKYSEFGTHSDIGYIAQELIKLIPEAVVSVPQDRERFGYDELYQINYTALIPYLTKAIQEMQEKLEFVQMLLMDKDEKINVLDNKVDSLLSIIEELKNEINQLKSKD